MLNRRRVGFITAGIFVLSMICYAFIEGRDFISSFYGSCMLITLQGQDDAPETDFGKLTISFLSILSSTLCAIWWWIIIEEILETGNRDNFKIFVPILLLFSFLVTMLIYLYVEERDFVDSIYGTVMLLTLQGQDDAPETNSGKLLIGLLSIFSAFILNVCIWVTLENHTEDSYSVLN